MGSREEPVRIKTGSRWTAKAARAVRRRTASFRALPDFVVGGTQKGGTSSLFAWLARHPAVIGSRVKEVHFFDKKHRHGEKAYRAEFPLRATLAAVRARHGVGLTGEATPSYLPHPAVPARMAKVIPNAKLVFLLRDPVERAYSHYRMSFRRGFEKLSFEAALDAETERMGGELDRLRDDPNYFSDALRHHSYAHRGDYAPQLDRFLDHFPREQMLIQSSESLFETPDVAWREVLEFLELPLIPLQNRTAENVGGEGDAMDPNLRDHLCDRFVESNERLFALLGRRFPWSSSSIEPAEEAS